MAWTPDQPCARVSNSGHLVSMARRYYRVMQQTLEKIPTPPIFHNEEDAMFYAYENLALEAEVCEAATITIAFAAFAVEGYIYDVAARALGDDFVKENIDKLSTQSKWVLVPRLAANHEVNTRGRAYQLLTALMRARAEIVHPKSQDRIRMTEEKFAQWMERSSRLPQRAKDAIAALDELGKEACKFDPFLASGYFDLAREPQQARPSKRPQGPQRSENLEHDVASEPS